MAIGIDLGTTNSLVAVVRSGVAEVLPDLDGNKLLPSVVRYGVLGVSAIGGVALREQVIDPANTIVSVKRFMGRGLADVQRIHGGTLPYRFVDAPGMVKLHTAAGEKSPVEVSADLLEALKFRAEDALFGGAQKMSGTLAGAVITVPAYFDDAQRQATKDAAQIAGLHVLRLINEPTAAALAYGLDNAAEGIYAIYDLGGGTFDISILRLTKGVFEVLSTGGDSALGGDDFDRAIVDWLGVQGVLPSTPSARDARKLAVEARAAKERLTGNDVTHFTVEELGLNVPLSRVKFDECTAPLVKRTLSACRKALRDAALQASDILGVVLVGGATRMPAVRRAVGELFCQEPLTNLNPDEVVALGAALQANQLAGNRSAGDDWLLLDVIPLSLGLETMGGLVEKILPRNTTIPAARAQEFTTFKDGQTALALHVVQGERELVSDCRSLARFELRGIPPLVAGAARIRVTFQVDADGLLEVSAEELTSGIKAQVAVKPAYGLSDDDIAAMLKSGFDEAEGDMRARALAEQQVEARRMLDAIEVALAADAALLNPEERAALDARTAALSTQAAGNDHLAIKQAIDALNRASEPFAAKRMDQSIRAALKGRAVTSL